MLVPKLSNNKFVKIQLLKAVNSNSIQLNIKDKPKPVKNIINLTSYSALSLNKKMNNKNITQNSPNANNTSNITNITNIINFANTADTKQLNFESSKEKLFGKYEDDDFYFNKNNASTGINDKIQIDRLNMSDDITTKHQIKKNNSMNEDDTPQLDFFKQSFNNESSDGQNLSKNSKEKYPFSNGKLRSKSEVSINMPKAKIDSPTSFRYSSVHKGSPAKENNIGNAISRGLDAKIEKEKEEIDNRVGDSDAKNEPVHAMPSDLLKSNNLQLNQLSASNSCLSPKNNLRLSILERNNLNRSNSNFMKNFPSPAGSLSKVKNLQDNNSNNSNLQLNEKDFDDSGIIQLKDIRTENKYKTANNRSFVDIYSTKNSNKLGNLNKTFMCYKKNSDEKIFNYRRKSEEHLTKVPLKKITKRLSQSFINAKENFTNIVSRRLSLGIVDPKKINMKYSVSHITSRLGISFN